jgi:hypothetical protein
MKFMDRIVHVLVLRDNGLLKKLLWNIYSPINSVFGVVVMTAMKLEIGS